MRIKIYFAYTSGEKMKACLVACKIFLKHMKMLFEIEKLISWKFEKLISQIEDQLKNRGEFR